jgi:hypothetical protein
LRSVATLTPINRANSGCVMPSRLRIACTWTGSTTVTRAGLRWPRWMARISLTLSTSSAKSPFFKLRPLS